VGKPFLMPYVLQFQLPLTIWGALIKLRVVNQRKFGGLISLEQIVL